LVAGIVSLGAILVIRRRGFPVRPATLTFAFIIAMVGTIIPNSTFYISVARLPAGVMSIIISTIPLISFPIALALGMDRFSAVRFAGLLCGILGVVLIAAPAASLPDPAMAAWLPLAMVGPVCYAIEGNIVARWGTAGLDPVQAMFGASVVGALVALPLMLGSGQWFEPFSDFGRPEAALLVSSVMHAFLYAGYVALAASAGAVFASQTSYVVTGSGVLWAMLLLGERFSGWIWLALAVMITGLFLVQPRQRSGQNA
jgi:drug/metabolite transporter (DMT)-like permease